MSAVTVPVVRAALVTRFTTDLAAASRNVPVFYGHPGKNIPPAYVAVASTVEGVERSQQRMPLRQTSMEEKYGLNVIVWHQTGAHDSAGQQAMVEAAWQTVAVIEAGLRADYTLGSKVTWALFTSFDDQDFRLQEGRAAEITCTVTVHVTRA